MNLSNQIAKGILKATIVLALTIGVLWLLYQIHSIIIYIVIALILTLIGNPIMDFFKKRLKFNNLFAASATLFFFILILVGFIMLFIPLAYDQGKNLSLLNVSDIEKNAQHLLHQITHYLQQHNINTNFLLDPNTVASQLDIAFVPNFLNNIVNTLGSLGMGLASVFFITFFFLKDRVQFVVLFKKIIPDTQEDKILNSLSKTNALLSSYFIGLLLQLLIVFSLYLIVLLIFGITNSFVIAFICAVLNIIPYIGPLIGSIFAGLLTMISKIGLDFQTEILPTTMYVLIGFWIVQLIDNNLSQPIIFSKSVKSHPLEIFLVILAAGFLFGIVGMIIAIPLFTTIKVFLKEFFPEHKVIQALTKGI